MVTQINYNLVFRIIFISILVCVCLVASSFMVLESSEFFERFYTEADSKNFGFISAFLNEVFLVIMASVWVPAIQRGEKKKFHPANILIKGLVILLFINTVGGASLNTVQKKLATIQEQKNRIGILQILESQIEDQQENIDTFIGQEQRINTVLATRKLNEIKEELKKLQTSQQSTFSLWIDILFISFVRFAIQLANITSVWLASWLYRNPLSNPLRDPLLHTYKPSVAPKLSNKKIAFSKIEEDTTAISQERENFLNQTNHANGNSGFTKKKPEPPLIQSSNQQTIVENLNDISEETSESIVNKISEEIGEVPNTNLLNLANHLGITLAQIKKLHNKDAADFKAEKLQNFLSKMKEMKETGV